MYLKDSILNKIKSYNDPFPHWELDHPLSEEMIDFNISGSGSPTSISVYQINSSGNPQYYLLKKNTKVISAERKTTTFQVGPAEKFLKLNFLKILRFEDLHQVCCLFT